MDLYSCLIVRRRFPFTRYQPFQYFSYIYISGAAFDTAAAPGAGKITQYLRKEIELLVEAVAHTLVKMPSRIVPAGDLGKCIVKAGVPGLETPGSLPVFFIEQKKTMARRTDQVTRAAFDACRRDILPEPGRVIVLPEGSA